MERLAADTGRGYSETSKQYKDEVFFIASDIGERPAIFHQVRAVSAEAEDTRLFITGC